MSMLKAERKSLGTKLQDARGMKANLNVHFTGPKLRQQVSVYQVFSVLLGTFLLLRLFSSAPFCVYKLGLFGNCDSLSLQLITDHVYSFVWYQCYHHVIYHLYSNDTCVAYPCSRPSAEHKLGTRPVSNSGHTS